MRSLHRAFTLVEMLAVMVVVVVVLTLTVPALKTLAGSSGLNGATSQIANLFTSARQNSVSRGVLTAVALLTDTTNNPDSAYCTFTLLELAAPADGSTPTNWRQISRWETLPKGIVVDASTDSNGNAHSPYLQNTIISPALPTLRYATSIASFQAGTGYAYQIFLPDGRPSLPPSPCALQLVEGYYAPAGTAPVYTAQGKNWANILLNDATGEIKITRP